MNRRWRWLLRATLLAAVLALMLPQFWYFAQVRHFITHDPDSTAFMETRLAALREQDPDARLAHEWIDYEHISPALVRAVIAAEDARFVHHGGIDWDAMRKAMRENRTGNGRIRGGSTITQQLAKNLFLSERRTYTRKVQEAAIALMIEATMDKRRILELYLNVIEWGDGVFGVEAAARHYHGIGAADLDARQASLLAARIPRPRFYHDRGTTPFLVQRARAIGQWMGHVRVPE